MRCFSLLLVFVYGIFSPTEGQVFDLTIVPKAKGKDVVAATLKKISRSEIFPSDHEFLRRVAFYETKFGTANHTFQPEDNFGGIWQIAESKFNLTQGSSPNLTIYWNRINSTFGIDWPLLSWNELLKPLHSALAARLWLSTLPAPIPQTIETQARFWVTHYNASGNVEQFIQEVREYEKNPEYRGLMDLGIVLDGSGSITPEDFEIGKGFVLSLVASFSLQNVRSGFIVYSDESEVIFPLQHNHTYDALRQLILNASHPMGLTQTNDAILTAVNMINNVTHFREGVPRILTVFTDGMSTGGVTDGPLIAANESIISFGVGIGDLISEQELFLIAGNESSRVHQVQSYDALTEFFYTLNTLTCQVPQEPGLNSTLNDTLVQDEKRYFEFQITFGGLTINIDVSVGAVTGYYSYTEETPSSALYDGLINGASVFIPWRNITGAKGHRARQADGEGAPLFVTIVGGTDSNDYSLEASIGDSTPTETSSTDSSSTTIVTEPSSTTIVTEPSSTTIVTEPSSTTIVTEPSSTTIVTEPSSTTIVTEPSSTTIVTEPSSTTIVTETSSTTIVTEPSSTTIVNDPSSTTVTETSTRSGCQNIFLTFEIMAPLILGVIIHSSILALV